MLVRQNKRVKSSKSRPNKNWLLNACYQALTSLMLSDRTGSADVEDQNSSVQAKQPRFLN